MRAATASRRSSIRRKRFAGPTGLEEYVGCGVGMALTVYARDGALIFRSKDYFVQLLGRRLCLPASAYVPARSMSPMPSCPTASSASRCRSSIRGFGLLIRQMAMFREIAP